MKLSPYELQAIRTISLDTPYQDILLAQLVKARCDAREYTGVGLYTKILVDATAPKLNIDFWKIEDLPKGYAEHPDLAAGVSIILWLKDGYMTCLESYTHEGDWPKNESLFRISTQPAVKGS